MDEIRVGQIVEEVAKEGGEQLKRYFKTSFRVDQKDDDSLVTEADLASEKAIIHKITEHFPNDLIFSEEAGKSSLDRTPGTYVWIIDPLDGTTNFTFGYDFFCVSIARGVFTNQGTIDVQQGAIYEPIRDKMYFAQKGGGAFCNGQPIRTREAHSFPKSFLVTGFYYNQGVALEQDVARFRRVADACQNIRRDGAAALDLALVAEGIFHGFWEKGLQPWDMAAGSLLVKEASGFIRTYESEDWHPEAETIIAGNKKTVTSLAELIET